MTQPHPIHWTAFEGYRLLADGAPDEVARAVKQRLLDGPDAPILVFDRTTGQQVDIDLRGSLDDVAHWVSRVVNHVPTPMPREPLEGRRGPGRKKLGVIAREVTLLPRHWDWLNRQPGGASAALRKLVDDARTRFAERDRRRDAQERTYRFMSAIAGNLPDFEEASRALFASDTPRLQAIAAAWPEAIRAMVMELSTIDAQVDDAQ